MSAPTECRICAGSLALVRRGGNPRLSPEGFAPANHGPGQHGDLYRCVECGTVQQASLPDGVKLHELYRLMRDDRYLVEEDGRRRTARRLLDLIGEHVRQGRLLDVGSGYGL